MNASVCFAIVVPVALFLLFVGWLIAELSAGKTVRITFGILCFIGLMLATCWGFYWAFAWHFQAMTAMDTMSIAQEYLEADEVAEAKEVLESHLSSHGR